MTGLLPDADLDLAVMGVMFQLGGLAYMVSSGLQGMTALPAYDVKFAGVKQFFAW